MTTTTTASGDDTILLSEAEAKSTISLLPYPRVTKQAIEAKIRSKSFFITESLLTICVITMRNGFEVTGEDACVDKRNYNRDLGKSLAYENAFRKLWPLEGYLLRDTVWKAEQYMPEDFRPVTE